MAAQADSPASRGGLRLRQGGGRGCGGPLAVLRALITLVTLRRLSRALMGRIHRDYRIIVGFNFSLIVLGVLGILPPTMSALLHNMSTLGIGLKSMTNMLEEPKYDGQND